MFLSRRIVYILGDSILLASGVLLILFSCIQYTNWIPIIAVIASMLGVAAPLIMGDIPASYIIVGCMVVLGYALPFELWRGNRVPLVVVMLVWAGESLIWGSILIFAKLIKNEQDF